MNNSRYQCPCFWMGHTSWHLPSWSDGNPMYSAWDNFCGDSEIQRDQMTITKGRALVGGRQAYLHP